MNTTQETKDIIVPIVIQTKPGEPGKVLLEVDIHAYTDIKKALSLLYSNRTNARAASRRKAKNAIKSQTYIEYSLAGLELPQSK